MSIPNGVNNVQNMSILNGQCIKAQTNIFSHTIFAVSSITDSKSNRICNLDCFLAISRSISNKMSEEEEYVPKYNPDVIMISESWAHDSISDVEVNLNGLKLFTRDRLCSKGGGCMLYVKELHKTIAVDDLTNVPDSESMWCELTSTKHSLVIGVCYHSTFASVANEVVVESPQAPEDESQQR